MCLLNQEFNKQTVYPCVFGGLVRETLLHPAVPAGRDAVSPVCPSGLVGISFTKEPQSLVVVPGDEVVFTCGVNLDADHLT